MLKRPSSRSTSADTDVRKKRTSELTLTNPCGHDHTDIDHLIFTSVSGNSTFAAWTAWSDCDSLAPLYSDRARFTGEWQRLYKEHPKEIDQIWDQCTKQGSFTPLRRIALFRKPADRIVRVRSDMSAREVEATSSAWKEPYKGNAAAHFCRVLDDMNIKRLKQNNMNYSNMMTIVQSSGTGKSRMVDEAAKIKFTIPVNLREKGDDSGFPKADGNVREWLTIRVNETSHQAELRFMEFLQNLFAMVTKEVRGLPARSPGMTLAKQWREYIHGHRDRLYNGVITSCTRGQKKELSEIRDEGSKAAVGLAEAVRADDAPQDKPDQEEEGSKIAGVGLAEAVRADNEPQDKPDLEKESNKTAEELVKVVKTSMADDKSKNRRDDVVIVLYFDEAHRMTTDYTTPSPGSPEKSAYQVLCSAINQLDNSHLFVIFLSTSTSLSSPCPSQSLIPSARVRHAPTDPIQPPFVEMPFDTWKEPIIVGEDKVKLADVCEPSFMARFGRPLFWTRWEHGGRDVRGDLIKFAMAKLSGGQLNNRGQRPSLNPDAEVAVLALRLHLTFEPIRESAVATENRLVKGHMRIAYSVPAHREYMRTGTPSEPLLAEAAARLMHGAMRDIPHALNALMDNGLIGKGERGEVVARLLLTLAHDKAAIGATATGSDEASYSTNQRYSVPIKVLDFISALVGKDNAEMIFDSCADNVTDKKTFRESFKDSYVHFTHFGKASDSSIVNDEAAFIAMARGMGWQCFDQQYGIDIILPILMWEDECLGRFAMSAILIQIKNRKEKKPVQVDADELHFFTPDSEGSYLDRFGMRPYVALVMELGLQPVVRRTKKSPVRAVPSLTMIQTGNTPARQSNYIQRKPAHPRYLIHITGCSNAVYDVIQPTENATYTQLLASNTLLNEHPRSDSESQASVLRMKPFWKAGEQSFGWVQPISEKFSICNPIVSEPQNVIEGITVDQYDSDADGSDGDEMNGSDVDMV